MLDRVRCLRRTLGRTAPTSSFRRLHFTRRLVMFGVRRSPLRWHFRWARVRGDRGQSFVIGRPREDDGRELLDVVGLGKHHNRRITDREHLRITYVFGITEFVCDMSNVLR